MIIQPDFIDHWRTMLLVDLLDGDDMAPLYLIRIFVHCQNRRKTQMKPMSNPAMKSLCRYKGDANKLVNALLESEYIVRLGEQDGDQGFDVPKFREHNAQLFTSWTNGSKGGRPRKKPTGNPRVTPDEPEPNPQKPEKRREEKRREDSKEENIQKKPAVPDDLSAFIDLWNGIGGNILKVKRITKPLIEKWTKAKTDPEIREALADTSKIIANIKDSPFLMGRAEWGGVYFQWLFKSKDGENNAVKIHSGRYNGEGRTNGQQRDPTKIETTDEYIRELEEAQDRKRRAWGR